MRVEEIVEKSFRQLLKGCPYRKITVAMICEDADISRKTFYSHFHNKEDIISYIFIRDVINPQRTLRSLLPDSMREKNSELFTSKLYEPILDDREFYYQLVGPLKGVDDTFIRVASHAIYDLARSVIDAGEYFSSEWEADYTTYFFATSQAMLMQKWISEGMALSPEMLGALYRKITIGFWEKRGA